MADPAIGVRRGLGRMQNAASGRRSPSASGGECRAVSHPKDGARACPMTPRSITRPRGPQTNPGLQMVRVPEAAEMRGRPRADRAPSQRIAPSACLEAGFCARDAVQSGGLRGFATQGDGLWSAWPGRAASTVIVMLHLTIADDHVSAPGLPALCASHAAFSCAGSTGRARMRRPVARKIALQIAAATGGTPGSPTPPGGALLGTI